METTKNNQSTAEQNYYAKYPDYYINKKRKVDDFFIGVGAAILIWLSLSIVAILVGSLIPTPPSSGLAGWYDPDWLIPISGPVGISFYIWKMFQHKRKFKAIGALIAAIIPFFISGSCILPMIQYH